MALLHIELESLRLTARNLALMTEELDWQIQCVTRSCQTLQSSWYGEGYEQFQAEMDHCLRNLRYLSTQIGELSVRIKHEANIWEEVGTRL